MKNKGNMCPPLMPRIIYINALLVPKKMNQENKYFNSLTPKAVLAGMKNSR